VEKSPSNFEQVRAFHERFQLPIGTRPQILKDHLEWDLPPRQGKEDSDTAIRQMRYAEDYIRQSRMPDDVAWGRIQMMMEELREFAEAVQRGDLADQADSLVDLAYFVLGTAVMMGLPWETLFGEVHRANMQKVLVACAEESKRLNKLDVKKPEGWQPPQIEAILAAETEWAELKAKDAA
jgi:predicted HAD superfamily Cof-like phosphohydrolase